MGPIGRGTVGLNRPGPSAEGVRRTDLAALALVALGLLVAGLALALSGAAAVLQGIAGLLLVAALVAFLLRFVPQAPPRPGVAFRRPGARERWCTVCGHPAPLGKPCTSCGNVPFSMRRKMRRLQKKQRPPAQEKKTKN